MTSPIISVSAPLLAGNEIEYVTDAVRSTWISSRGKYLDAVNRLIPEYVGVRYGHMVTSGTAALHLSLLAVGIGPGDEVIVPAFTMAASAFAVCYAGGMPVFVDSDPDTWTADPAAIEAAIGPRTRAIMAVHVYGHPCDMAAIARVADRHGLTVMEDAAEGLGAVSHGRRCGGWGRVAAFSFYANKLITSGEGGMVVTGEPDLHERARYFGNQCYPVGRTDRFVHDDVGLNYRATNLQAALLLAQFERIDALLDAKRRVARAYLEALAGIPGLQLPIERPWATNSYWMFGLLVCDEFPMTRDALALALRREGIETRPFFVPMHRQRAMLRYGCVTTGSFPVADRLGRQGLYLPSGAGLSPLEIEFVCDRIRSLAR